MNWADRTARRSREEEFRRKKSSCGTNLTHIEEGISDPYLREIDEVYGAADYLSILNAEKYRRILFALSAAGTLLAAAFLLYDEISLYGMIIVCGVLVLALFLMNRLAMRFGWHRNYLEYRLLAEGARVQYFLSKAGLRKCAADLLPWSWRFNVPWTAAVLEELGCGGGEGAERSGILDVWVRGQAGYHRTALVRTEAQIRRNDRITNTALILALATYAAALIFEIRAGGLLGGKVLLPTGQIETVRVILKVAMGSFSAMTLFAGNYYGRLSLEDTAQAHRRMAALYDKTEKEILRDGETEELLVSLAREELEESSNWYAYRNKNRPDISL